MDNSSGSSEERRAPNGLYYRVIGRGAPLLLLHGLIASGVMFDTLANLLPDDFRLLIPDLRGHGKSRQMGGPYDVATIAEGPRWLSRASGEAWCSAILTGAPWRWRWRERNRRRGRSCCWPAPMPCNVATLREYLEGMATLGLLSIVTPRTLAKVIVQPDRAGAMPGMTAEKAAWCAGSWARTAAKKCRPLQKVC
jgi:hypothetical protein